MARRGELRVEDLFKVLAGDPADRLGPGQDAHVVDAVDRGALADVSELAVLLGVGGDDQLAAIAMRNAVIGAISVERMPAADAHLRHQAAGAVVDAGMDHLAVARGGHRADALGRLKHDHFAAGQSEPAGHRKPDHTRSDNDAINSVHGQCQVRDFGARLGISRALFLSFRAPNHQDNPLVWLGIRCECFFVSEALIMSGQLP